MIGDRESRESPAERHRRPEDAADNAVAAAGRITEALETTEQARGHLYAFHQLTGRADGQLDAAVELLRAAGHDDLADEVERELIGRNVLSGRWTFQVVEEYDDGYYQEFRSIEGKVRGRLMEGRRHVFEAEMKERRRTHGLPDHVARPGDED
ncbi:hypothetical protein [Actinomadura sp. 7K534]|uniref:hypothetical protein n=1 Tax=Actinomadura sp. 7K534 TaxID=2530366 RepID=UPI001044F0E1|nr:hypothetical protein [Actinomadura sp. 7K534]TDB83616.1 hypothetical protein E1266_37355 [Actinomadura sp. 7K534]